MRNENGNVFIYILIAIVLLAALNAIISRSGEDGGSSQRLDEAQRSLLVDEIMLYASSADKAVRDMDRTGTDIELDGDSDTSDEFYIAKRGDSNYTDRPLHNLFHPNGGGLTYKTVDSYPDSLFASGATKTGWFYQTKTNVGWSDDNTINDVIYSLSGINKSICEVINQRITGSTNIPSASDTAENLFDQENGSNNDFTNSVCGECEGKPRLCIQDSNNDYVYYNILVTQ